MRERVLLAGGTLRSTPPPKARACLPPCRCSTSLTTRSLACQRVGPRLSSRRIDSPHAPFAGNSRWPRSPAGLRSISTAVGDVIPAPDRHQPPRPPRPVVLANDATVVVRQVGADDERAIAEFLATLQLTASAARFFTEAADVRRAAHAARTPDGVDYLGLLAIPADGRIVGHAAYIRLYGPCAEVAVALAEDHRQLGLATLLLARLAEVAEQHSIARFVADTAPSDTDMLAVFRDDFGAAIACRDGEANVEVQTAAWRPYEGTLARPRGSVRGAPSS